MKRKYTREANIKMSCVYVTIRKWRWATQMKWKKLIDWNYDIFSPVQKKPQSLKFHFHISLVLIQQIIFLSSRFNLKCIYVDDASSGALIWWTMIAPPDALWGHEFMCIIIMNENFSLSPSR